MPRKSSLKFHPQSRFTTVTAWRRSLFVSFALYLSTLPHTLVTGMRTKCRTKDIWFIYIYIHGETLESVLRKTPFVGGAGRVRGFRGADSFLADEIAFRGTKKPWPTSRPPLIFVFFLSRHENRTKLCGETSDAFKIFYFVIFFFFFCILIWFSTENLFIPSPGSLWVMCTYIRFLPRVNYNNNIKNNTQQYYVKCTRRYYNNNYKFGWIIQFQTYKCVINLFVLKCSQLNFAVMKLYSIYILCRKNYVYNGKSDELDLNNWRPITIFSIVCRIIEVVLTKLFERKLILVMFSAHVYWVYP